MDKKSEQSKDHKECGDTDIGIHKYGPHGNVREQLDGLWGVASKEVVGLPESRLMTSCYKKDDDDKASLIDKIMTSGPPVLNVSTPKRVF